MPLFLKLKENIRGEDYVVGDIHGCHEKLWEALEALSFDPSKDRLISVGDLVDRGTDSLLCLSLLTLPWFYAVRGNHEQMMLEALKFVNRDTFEPDYTQTYDAGAILRLWTQNGGDWFFDLAPHQKREVFRLCDEYVCKLPYAVEVPYNGFKYGIVHAEVTWDWWKMSDKLLKDSQLHRDCLLWDRAYATTKPDSSFIKACKGVDVLIAGHTPRPEVFWRANRLYIDTGACRHDGKLTVISLKELTEQIIAGTVPPSTTDN